MDYKEVRNNVNKDMKKGLIERRSVGVNGNDLKGMNDINNT